MRNDNLVFLRRLLPAVLFLSFSGALLAQDSKAKGKDVKTGKDKEKDKGAEKKTGGEEKGKTGSDGAAPASADEEYVKERLKDYLYTDVKFLENGRAQMTFDLTDKKEDHGGIFTPKVGGTMKDKLRWSKPDEEMVVGGEAGLRLSDQGFALLNCWFIDDVEAQMNYRQYVPHNDKLVAALVFSNDQGKGLGSNFGTQCALFSQGKSAGGQGKLDAVPFNSEAKIKLVVRDGQFEALRDGKSKQKMKYAKKTYASGRIGFAWGGSVAATITRLEITGKLDYPRMAKELRKAKP